MHQAGYSVQYLVIYIKWQKILRAVNESLCNAVKLDNPTLVWRKKQKCPFTQILFLQIVSAVRRAYIRREGQSSHGCSVGFTTPTKVWFIRYFHQSRIPNLRNNFNEYLFRFLFQPANWEKKPPSFELIKSLFSFSTAQTKKNSWKKIIRETNWWNYLMNSLKVIWLEMYSTLTLEIGFGEIRE